MTAGPISPDVAPLKVVSAHWRQLDITPAGPYNHMPVQGNVNEIVRDDAESPTDQLEPLMTRDLHPEPWSRPQPP